MTKRIVPVLMSFLLVATFAGVAGAQEKAPALTIDQPVKEFGIVPKGAKLDWSFTIRNTGNADLEILSASPSCGCTVADFDKVIKPGQSGKVSAHLDTNVAGVGPTKKYVTLQTNDPNAPTAQLTLAATIQPYVEAHPAGFVRYSLLQGEKANQSVVLFTEEKEPEFRIVSIEAPNDAVKVTHSKIENAEERVARGEGSQPQYRIDVAFDGAKAQVGPIAEKVRIVTNSKHQPEYWLTLSGLVRPTYSVFPTNLNFGEVRPGSDEATMTVVLKSNKTDGQPFKVNKVESTMPGKVVAEARQLETPGLYEVKVRLDEKAKGTVDGVVKIFTNDPVAPVFELPVKGMAKATS